jgi:hypothetical protein
MSMRRLSAAALVILAAEATVSMSDHPATAAAEPAAQNVSTADDQAELALTVYNSDLALVRDVRTLQLPRGTFDLQFMDIAATVNPATVHFRSVSEPERVAVVEQNYEYDLLEPERLLKKYVGRDVTLVRLRQDGGATREETLTARLLSFNNADHIRFPELPGNLYSRPTLVWTLANEGGARHRVEASYLASKLAWSADYVLKVSRDDRAADLDGWVTLANGSGTAFRNARLQLVAGDLNRVRQAFQRSDLAGVAERAMPASAPMAQEAFGEYHLYTLERQTTVNHSETKQVSMLAATGVPVRKRYVVDGQAMYYRNPQSPGSPIKDTVKVYYQLRNEERARLGMPLPAGIVRVYQADSKGGTHFVGEDRIGHTPKDETIDLRIGSAFDVVAERKQVDFEKVAVNVYELEYEIALRNHKPLPVTVEVNEPLGGTWRIIRTTHEAAKTDAWAARFQVPVPADGASVLRYRVRVVY